MEMLICELVDTVKDLNRLISLLGSCEDVEKLNIDDVFDASEYLEEYKNFILNRKVDI